MNNNSELTNYLDEELDTIIRQAEPSDAKALNGLLNHVNRETDFLIIESSNDTARQRELIERYAQTQNCLLLVVEADEQIIGMGNLVTLSNSKQAHVAEIGMALISEYWGYGIGSLLLGDLIDFAKSINLKILTLEVITANERAFKLYEKFGFEIVGTLKKHVKVDYKYYDSYVMELIL